MKKGEKQKMRTITRNPWGSTHTHTHTGTPSGYLRYAKIGYRSKLKTHVFLACVFLA